MVSLSEKTKAEMKVGHTRLKDRFPEAGKRKEPTYEPDLDVDAETDEARIARENAEDQVARAAKIRADGLAKAAAIDERKAEQRMADARRAYSEAEYLASDEVSGGIVENDVAEVEHGRPQPTPAGDPTVDMGAAPKSKTGVTVAMSDAGPSPAPKSDNKSESKPKSKSAQSDDDDEIANLLKK